MCAFYNRSMLLEGLFLPLTTPFFPDGRLNLSKLRQNVAHYSLTPAAGMLVLGANGEAASLSDSETREVFATALEAAAETKVMVAGVSRASLRSTLEMIADAAAMGYDAALVQHPDVASLRAAEAKIFMETVADQSTLPLVLGSETPLDLIGRLAVHPSVLGYTLGTHSVEDLLTLLTTTAAVKRNVTVTQVFAAVTRRMMVEQAGDGLLSAASLGRGTATIVGAARSMLKIRTKVVGFQILASRTDQMLLALQAGAIGVVSPFAAAAPQGCYEVYAAWKDGDTALAEEKQERLTQAIHMVEATLGVPGVKYGCDLNGYFGGVPRLPMLGLTGNERTGVEQVMAGLKS